MGQEYVKQAIKNCALPEVQNDQFDPKKNTKAGLSPVLVREVEKACQNYGKHALPQTPEILKARDDQVIRIGLEASSFCHVMLWIHAFNEQARQLGVPGFDKKFSEHYQGL